jgi:hypothetical protein
MPNQVDLTPASSNSTGLHVHVPSGSSASQVNNPTDTPSNPPQTGTGVAKKITGADGKVAIRFSNPS